MPQASQAPPVPARGFTLLEVLVVLVLIGVLLTFAAASLRGPDPADQLREEVRRLQALMQLATDEAVIQTRTYGVRLSPSGYAFVAYGEQGWQILDSRPLQPRTFPAHMALVSTPPATPATAEPHIVLYADGTLTPFELGFRSTAVAEAVHLVGNVNGELRIADAPAP